MNVYFMSDDGFYAMTAGGLVKLNSKPTPEDVVKLYKDYQFEFGSLFYCSNAEGKVEIATPQDPHTWDVV